MKFLLENAFVILVYALLHARLDSHATATYSNEKNRNEEYFASFFGSSEEWEGNESSCECRFLHSDEAQIKCTEELQSQLTLSWRLSDFCSNFDLTWHAVVNRYATIVANSSWAPTYGVSSLVVQGVCKQHPSIWRLDSINELKVILLERGTGAPLADCTQHFIISSAAESSDEETEGEPSVQAHSAEAVAEDAFVPREEAYDPTEPTAAAEAADAVDATVSSGSQAGSSSIFAGASTGKSTAGTAAGGDAGPTPAAKGGVTAERRRGAGKARRHGRGSREEAGGEE